MGRNLRGQRVAAVLISGPDGVEGMAEALQHPIRPVRQTVWIEIDT
jgi:hypothetical protein